MSLRLQKLQDANSKAQELRQQKANGYKKIDEIVYHQSLLFASKAIQKKLISHYHNKSLANHFGIEKTFELLAQKYYWPTLCNNI